MPLETSARAEVHVRELSTSLRQRRGSEEYQRSGLPEHFMQRATEPRKGNTSSFVLDKSDSGRTMGTAPKTVSQARRSANCEPRRRFRPFRRLISTASDDFAPRSPISVSRHDRQISRPVRFFAAALYCLGVSSRLAAEYIDSLRQNCHVPYFIHCHR